MSSTSPYVSLSSHYRFLHYIGSEPNPFAVFTPSTVQQRGAVRLRFHTPALIYINNMVNENVAWQEAESNEQKAPQKLLEQLEEQEEHDKEKESPYVYVMPLTSEDVYPKLTTNSINDGDVRAQSTWTSFSTLELAQNCCRRDVGWNVEQTIKREQDDSLYSMHSAKKSKLEPEQQVEEHQLEITVDNSGDETDNTINENTHEITKTTTNNNLSNLTVMRFVKVEVVIRSLLQVLLTLEQPRHSPCVQFTVETFSPSTLTFTVRSAKEEEEHSCNVNSLILRVTLSTATDKVHEQHKLHLAHVKKKDDSNKTSIYTNIHCVCSVIFDNQEAPHIADFSSGVIVVRRQVFDYVVLTHNIKAEETTVPITSMLSEILQEQSLNTIMLIMENNCNHNGLFSMIFDYNTEQKEEEEEQKQEEKEQLLNENTTGVRETETKPVISESERIITHVRERGFVFCALCAHYCRVESIKWYIMQSTSWKHYHEYAEKDKTVLRIMHLMPLQDHKIRRSTTWESILYICKYDKSNDKIEGQVKEQMNSILRKVYTLRELKKDLLLSIHVIGCEDMLHWQEQQQLNIDDTLTTLKSKTQWCRGSVAELLHVMSNVLK